MERDCETTEKRQNCGEYQESALSSRHLPLGTGATLDVLVDQDSVSVWVN